MKRWIPFVFGVYCINTNKISNHFTLINFCRFFRGCTDKGVIYVSIATVIFSLVKILSFCVKAHVEFHVWLYNGSRDGAVVRALAPYRCGSGSTLWLDVICRLSLLLVLFSVPRGFLQVLWFSPLLKNQHFQILIRSRFQWTKSHSVEVPQQIAII